MFDVLIEQVVTCTRATADLPCFISMIQMARRRCHCCIIITHYHPCNNGMWHTEPLNNYFQNSKVSIENTKANFSLWNKTDVVCVCLMPFPFTPNHTLIEMHTECVNGQYRCHYFTQQWHVAYRTVNNYTLG